MLKNIIILLCTYNSRAFSPTTNKLPEWRSRIVLETTRHQNSKAYKCLSSRNNRGLLESVIKLSQESNEGSTNEHGAAIHKNEQAVKMQHEKPKQTNILQAAFLVAGTTIGGGFLALPTVTAPTGFIPSAVSLTFVWMYFLAQSFILVECLINERIREELKTMELTSSERDFSPTPSSPGVSAVAYSTLGKFGEQITRLLLIILTEATLVSQISRAGALIFPNRYVAGCIISSLFTAFLVFGPPDDKGIIWSSKINSVFLWVFLISCGLVGLSGARTLGSNGGSISQLLEYQHWNAVPHTIPTFLQLLVYGEIIPVVCGLLHFHIKSIQASIFCGSLLTLLLVLGWSALGIALVPQSISATTKATVDPVNVLLATGGSIQKPLFCLAITAIMTTIIGSYLALLSAAQDLTSKDIKSETKGNSENKEAGLKASENIRKDVFTNSGLKRLVIASIIAIPALSIASISPDLFLTAIDFAGSYPVLVLWGILPPVMALVQRKQNHFGGKKNNIYKNIGGPTSWLIILMVISTGFVGFNVKNDLLWIFGKLRPKLI